MTYQLLLDMGAVTADLIQIVQIQVMVEDLWAMAVVAVVMPLIKEIGLFLVQVLVVIGAMVQTQQLVNKTVPLHRLVQVQALQADIIVQLMEHLVAVVWVYTALVQTVLRLVQVMVAAAVQVVPAALTAKFTDNLQV
jgi:hypothetical protein